MERILSCLLHQPQLQATGKHGITSFTDHWLNLNVLVTITVKEYVHILYLHFSGKKFYSIALDTPLGAGKQIVVNVETVHSHSLQPYPAQIAQSEKQYVKFDCNMYMYSPYKVTTQTTIVNTATSNIESYTKTSPVSVSDSTITYGPFTDKEPFSEV